MPKSADFDADRRCWCLGDSASWPESRRTDRVGDETSDPVCELDAIDSVFCLARYVLSCGQIKAKLSVPELVVRHAPEHLTFFFAASSLSARSRAAASLAALYWACVTCSDMSDV